MDYPSDPKYGLSGGKFTEGDPSTGLQASILPAPWGNGITDEIIAVIVAGGLSPNEGTLTQLRDAINQLIADALAGGATAVLNEGGTPSMKSGTFAARPAAGTAGRIYVATDTRELWRDTGSAWEQLYSNAGSIVANGYISLPTDSGVTLIIQWSTLTPVPQNTTTVVALPTTFPNAAFGALATSGLLADENIDLSCNVSTTQWSLHNPRSTTLPSAFLVAFGY